MWLWHMSKDEVAGVLKQLLSLQTVKHNILENPTSEEIVQECY
jgi:hypothetical protein